MTATPTQRFLDGMMKAIELPAELLDQPGTSVVGREGRAGTGLALCYRVNSRAMVWLDPALEDRFADLAVEGAAIEPADFSHRADELGMNHLADAQMKLLPGSAIDLPPVPEPYRHERLTNDDVDRVRGLTERCSEQDVDEAALDELDEFDEQAINVLTPSDGDGLIAYGSASEWDWDDGFGDIGVLIDPNHRKRGLGAWVVSATVADLLDNGVLPLYRHHLSNIGSDALSASLGFETITWVQAYQLRPSDD